jgi:hypothetical protein
MFPIYEISAAPHFPQPLKSDTSATEVVYGQGVNDIEFAARDGEIYVALTAS